MLVSRYYGLGLLTAIAHKTLMETLIKEENQIQMNPVNALVNAVGDLLNLAQNRRLNPANVKWIDKVLPYMTAGAALFDPVASLIIGFCHVLIKYKYINLRLGEINVKANEANPLKKRDELRFFTFLKIVITGLAAVPLLRPITSQEVTSARIKTR